VQFLENENGAVSLDWIVLVAALVGLAIATATVVSGRVSPAVDAPGSGHVERGAPMGPATITLPLQKGPH
jgi:Flp pilus assembly pilin Flp